MVLDTEAIDSVDILGICMLCLMLGCESNSDVTNGGLSVRQTWDDRVPEGSGISVSTTNKGQFNLLLCETSQS